MWKTELAIVLLLRRWVSGWFMLRGAGLGTCCRAALICQRFVVEPDDLGGAALGVERFIAAASAGTDHDLGSGQPTPYLPARGGSVPDEPLTSL